MDSAFTTDRYEHQFGCHRSITEKVFFRYLDCGILRHGFARIRCDHCHKVVANDTEGRKRLARYFIRPPVSLERLAYDREGQMVFYQGKDQTSTYDPLDFLAYVSLHIPDKGEQLLRYYGWYSNKSRGHQHPGQSMSVHLTQMVPATAPLGTYTYNGNVGPYPLVWDYDSFTFSVTNQ